MADPRIFSSCSTSVQVCEGFAPFIRGDTGIAASFAVLVHTFEIVSAIDPTQKPGFFYKAFKNTMNKFCSDLPKTEMVRYIAIDPVKPEFEVYENMTVHTGLQEALLRSGNVVDPELVSMVRVWHSEGENWGFVDTIPLPVEIESMIPTCPDGPEDEVKLNALASNIPMGRGSSRVLWVRGSEAFRVLETPAAAHVVSETSQVLNHLNMLNLKNSAQGSPLSSSHG